MVKALHPAERAAEEMNSTVPLSADAVDKLQAILNHNSGDPGDGLGENYLQAAAAWFAGLSDRDKATADMADAAFAFGDELRAEEIAAPLPAAPKFPLP